MSFWVLQKKSFCFILCYFFLDVLETKQKTLLTFWNGASFNLFDLGVILSSNNNVSLHFFNGKCRMQNFFFINIYYKCKQRFIYLLTSKKDKYFFEKKYFCKKRHNQNIIFFLIIFVIAGVQTSMFHYFQHVFNLTQ